MPGAAFEDAVDASTKLTSKPDNDELLLVRLRYLGSPSSFDLNLSDPAPYERHRNP